MNKKPTVLVILDGYGISTETEANGVHLANTPNLDNIFNNNPYTLGTASGMEVGLPRGQMGNSEVGHTNIGAGRVVYQELTRITKSIEDGDFFTNPTLLSAMTNAKEAGKALHLAGLLSDGGVHSHQEHLYALLKMAKGNGVTRVYIHAFMDGRDTAPTSGKGYLEALYDQIEKIGVGEVATMSGRYYALDRDNRWERVSLAYDAMANGKGVLAECPIEAIEKFYKGELTEKPVQDEFVLPTVLTQEDGKTPVATVNGGDSFVFFNFRPDRAREISYAFVRPEFDGFPRERGHLPLKFLCFTDYDANLQGKEVVFTSDNLSNTLGEHLAKMGKTQMRLAETEKYPHVTFFFNGGVEAPFAGEERVLVPSPKVATYDLQPEMSAPEVTEKLVEGIESGKYDFILVNYANPDMVGHTGDIDAVVKSIETVDQGVGQALAATLKMNGQMFVCADHGNADKMIDYDTREPHTAHTTNPVPFAIVNSFVPIKGLREGGKLGDIAPTVLELMGVDKPAEMTGESLLVK